MQIGYIGAKVYFNDKLRVKCCMIRNLQETLEKIFINWDFQFDKLMGKYIEIEDMNMFKMAAILKFKMAPKQRWTVTFYLFYCNP